MPYIKTNDTYKGNQIHKARKEWQDIMHEEKDKNEDRNIQNMKNTDIQTEQRTNINQERHTYITNQIQKRQNKYLNN